MAELIYGLCALVSLTCALLLHRGAARTRHALLLWAAACFWLLALNNVLLFVDLVLADDTDLAVARRLTAAAAPMVFLLGLIWSDER